MPADRHRLEAIAKIILATADGCGTTEIMRRSGKATHPEIGCDLVGNETTQCRGLIDGQRAAVPFYAIATGKLERLDAHLEEYVAMLQNEAKSLDIKRSTIRKFTQGVSLRDGRERRCTSGSCRMCRLVREELVEHGEELSGVGYPAHGEMPCCGLIAS